MLLLIEINRYSLNFFIGYYLLTKIKRLFVARPNLNKVVFLSLMSFSSVNVDKNQRDEWKILHGIDGIKK